jgi:uncharacterized membrane protein (DUF485 family)
MTALLEDTVGEGGLSTRERVSIAMSGLAERARGVGLMGTSSTPNEQIRAGSLLVLCAWALFVVAGSIFAKFSEQWDAHTPRVDRWLPADSYDAVQWAALAGAVIVLGAAVLVMPTVIRLTRMHGWKTVQRPLVRSAVALGIAIVATVGIVAWAHSLGSVRRNEGFAPYGLVLTVWGTLIVAVIATGTADVVRLMRSLSLSGRTWRTLGASATALALIMAVIMTGTLLWWGSVATYGPSFLGEGPLSISNVVPPPMIVAGTLMLIGLLMAAIGVWRVTRSMKVPPRVI